MSYSTQDYVVSACATRSQVITYDSTKTANNEMSSGLHRVASHLKGMRAKIYETYTVLYEMRPDLFDEKCDVLQDNCCVALRGSRIAVAASLLEGLKHELREAKSLLAATISLAEATRPVLGLTRHQKKVQQDLIESLCQFVESKVYGTMVPV